MSVEQVEELLRRATTEPGYAALIGADPKRMTEYDLTEEEQAALLGQNVEKLREMGVDPELAEGAEMIGKLTG
jgi:hypothetical protein